MTTYSGYNVVEEQARIVDNLLDDQDCKLCDLLPFLSNEFTRGMYVEERDFSKQYYEYSPITFLLFHMNPEGNIQRSLIVSHSKREIREIKMLFRKYDLR